MQDAEECPIGLRVIRNFGVIPGVTNCAVLRDAAFGSAQICRLWSQTAASQEALMSIKRILVPLPGSASHTGEIEMALSAAKALGAHVQALFISQPPPVTRGGVSVSELGRTATVAPAHMRGLTLAMKRDPHDAGQYAVAAACLIRIPVLRP
jgi:hypothetical protein